MLHALALSMGLLCWSHSVSAQDHAAAPRASDLSQQGRFMASGQVGGFWSSDQSGSYASFATWTLYAHPALTYFVRDNLGFGGVLDGSWSTSNMYPAGSSTGRTLGAGVELVWSVPFAQRWSVMMRPSVGYAHEWAEVTWRGASFSDLGRSPPGRSQTRAQICASSTRSATSASAPASPSSTP